MSMMMSITIVVSMVVVVEQRGLHGIPYVETYEEQQLQLWLLECEPFVTAHNLDCFLRLRSSFVFWGLPLNVLDFFFCLFFGGSIDSQ